MSVKPSLEELRQMMELLKEAEGLQDPTVRTHMQQLILGPPQIVTVQNGHDPRPAPPTPKPTPKPPSRKGSSWSEERLKATDMYKVSEALRMYASRAKPLSGADLAGMIEGVVDEDLSSTLSNMYMARSRGRYNLHRVRVYDQTLQGLRRTLWKYYIEDENAVQVSNGS